MHERRTVNYNEFSLVKTAVETHIAEDNVKWKTVDKLVMEMAAMKSRITWCSGAIAMLMFLDANHVLDIRPWFKAEAQASEIVYGR